jgi:hypothetical protein
MLWRNPLTKEGDFQKTVFLCLAVTLISLAFSIRIVNSISLIVLVAIVLIHPQRLNFFRRSFSNPYFLSCLFLFIIHVIGSFYTERTAQSWKEITSNAIWLAIPFFFCTNPPLQAKAMRRLMACFSVSLFMVSLTCLLYAIFVFSQQHKESVFFYHNLVKPFKHHAVLF